MAAATAMAPKAVAATARIGFVGLGAMGYPIAGHIARAKWAPKSSSVLSCQGTGVNLAPMPSHTGETAATQTKHMLVYNRTASVASSHAQTWGSVACQSLAELGSCSVVFTCLPTSAEVKQVVDQLEPLLTSGTVWVDCTSGSPAQTKEIADRLLSRRGVCFLDAPVSGGPKGAKDGTLTVGVSGDQRAFDYVAPLLTSFTKTVTYLGPQPGTAHAVKAINNALNVTQLMLCAEGLSALKAMGADPEVALSFINNGSGRSLISQERVPTEVIGGRFGYGFKLGLMLKDLKIANEMCDSYYKDASLLRASLSLLKEAEEKVGYSADYTEAAKVIADKARVKLSKL